MGDKIYVKSQEGVGSEFYFVVPLIEAKAVQIAPFTVQKKEQLDHETTSITILVVEDNKVD